MGGAGGPASRPLRGREPGLALDRPTASPTIGYDDLGSNTEGMISGVRTACPC